MLRYVAFLWNERSSSPSHHAQRLSTQLEAGKRWRSVLDLPGVRIWCQGSSPGLLEPHLLAEDGGVVFGSVFGKSAGDSFAALASVPHASRGRVLIERCWGRYVAFLRDNATNRFEVIRDPSGAMRCFFTMHAGVHVFCSHVEDLTSLGLPFTINWNYVVAELANQAAMGWDQTGLNELASLRAGECLQIDENDARRVQLWDISRFARSRPEDHTLDPRDVRDVVRQCVLAWASRTEHAVLLLSGGLDSSVILSCMVGSPCVAAVSCLNYFCEGPYRADERAYARLAAQRAQCKLTELQRRTDVSLDQLLVLPRSARPSDNNIDHLLNHERTSTWAKGRDATAILTGDLGDQLFCRQLTGHATMDCLWTLGLCSEFIRVVNDVARIDAGSFSGPLISGCLYGYATRIRWLRGRSARAEQRHDTNPYLHARAADEYDHRLQQRWLESIDDLPLGKLLHIASISGAQAYLTPIGGADDPEWIAPLNSQPIVELCTRIPVWKFVRNGKDRSVLREAFARDVPAEIIHRRSKGTTSTQRVAVYACNAAFLREALMDGVLAGRGLLDVDRLGRDLRAQDYRHNIWLERCIRVETWLRMWGSSGQRAPVASDHLSLSAKYV